MMARWYEKPVGYYLRPAGGSIFFDWARDTPLKGLPLEARLAPHELVGPYGTVKDFKEGAQGIAGGVLALSPVDAIQGGGQFLSGLLGVVPPGLPTLVGENQKIPFKTISYGA